MLDSAVGYKTWVTRSINAGERAIADLQNAPTPQSVTAVNRFMDESVERFKSLENHMLEIIKLDPKTIDEVTAELDEYEKKQSKFWSVANEEISNAKLPNEGELSAPPAAPRGGQAAAQRTFKPNLAAKPTKALTKEYSPSELRKWLEQWKTYYNTSNMQVLSLPDQHTQLCLELSDDLADYMRNSVSSRTPMFANNNEETGSCIGYLQAKFLRLYPMVTRRYKFFLATQKQGERLSDFEIRLQGLGKEADVSTLTTEQLYIF